VRLDVAQQPPARDVAEAERARAVAEVRAAGGEQPLEHRQDVPRADARRVADRDDAVGQPLAGMEPHRRAVQRGRPVAAAANSSSCAGL
jgi:hypothetical protein